VEVLTAVNVGGCFGFYGDFYSHAACFAGGTAFPSMLKLPFGMVGAICMGRKTSTG
jgi:hypothetical protein